MANQELNQELINAVKLLQDWIVESEMGLNISPDEDGYYKDEWLDKTDSFYPAFQRLEEVREKLEEE